MNRRLLATWLALLTVFAVPQRLLAQTAPPPPLVEAPPTFPPEPPPGASVPSYPSLAPAPATPSPNLSPYPQAAPPPAPASKEEGLAKDLLLMGAEFTASSLVSVGSGLALYAALANSTDASGAASAQIAVLLYLGLIPIVTSLPVWLISLASDRYETRIGPAIEAGSALASVALLILLLAGDSRGALLGAGAILIAGMPLAEVVALNVTRRPKYGAGPPLATSPPPWEPLAGARQALPAPGQVVLSVPLLSF